MISIALQLPVILTGMVIAQGLFAALVLAFVRTNKLANRFLALLLLTLSLWMIDSFFRIGGIYQQEPNYYFKPIFYSFAFGPLIYCYVKSITNSSFRFRTPHLWHFLPVLIQAVLYWFLSFQDYPFRRWFWFEVHQPTTYSLEFNLTFLSLAIYLILSVRLLAQYQVWLKDHFSEPSKIQLNWLRMLLSLMLLLSLLWAIDAIYRDFYNIYLALNYSEISLGLIILLLAFGGIRQSNISQVFFEAKSTKANPPLEDLDPALIKRIRQRMETEKDYLNPTLTLQEFAASLQLPPRRVSRHINHGIKLPFIDFVNQYRVAAVKQKIAEGRLGQYTLLSIAMESGFNSKSTFNRIFKKFTNTSPSDYVKQNKRS